MLIDGHWGDFEEDERDYERRETGAGHFWPDEYPGRDGVWFSDFSLCRGMPLWPLHPLRWGERIVQGAVFCEHPDDWADGPWCKFVYTVVS